MAILPTHHSRFQPIPVHRSGLRLREKYVLLLIFIAFLLLCFGAFFFVPDLRDRTYLENAYKKFVGAGGDILPIRPPKTPIVKHVEEATSLPNKREGDDLGAENQNVEVNVPQKTPTKLSLNHKELMEKIRKDKEKFREEKKSQKEAEKRAKIEKLVNNSKVDETGAKGITGGEPSDEIAKTRRNFIKKVR
ncbi:unnamed protein product [Porites lobata]|uniref:Uncharacterized protein n=1 Tax=Porites lobata TaxID=104759 RepID=A0ABN8QV17_9CNID|nr:unnamed protein product [Porites lobata]